MGSVSTENKDNGDGSYEYVRKLLDAEYQRLFRHDEELIQRINLDAASSHFKEFSYWEKLPTEIRCMIAKETDLVTRFSFMYSSKTNYEIARSVPMRIKSIKIDDQYNNNHPWQVGQKNMRFSFVELTSELGDVTFIYFLRERSATRVFRYWLIPGSGYKYETKELLKKKRNYIEESESFLEKLLALTDYRLDAFNSRDGFAIDGATFFDKLKVLKKLEIFSSDVGDGDVTRLLNTAISPLDILEIDYFEYKTAKFSFNHETINNAKNLYLTIYNKLRDFSYYNLKCEKFVISSPDNSSESINQFLKKWINGEISNNFLYGEFANPQNHLGEAAVPFDRSVILRDIDHVRWDDQFKRENKEICDMIGSLRALSYYHIESKKGGLGATLVFNSNKVTVIVTGKRSTRKRRASGDD